MHFCSECHNMYYLKIQDEDGVIGNTLIYYCRNCGHENKTLSTTNICVSDIQFRSSEKKYTNSVNEYTKYDPTLPRINTIKCPNQDCISNGTNGGGGKEEGSSKPKTMRIAKSATAKKTKAETQALLVDAKAEAEALEIKAAKSALKSVNQSAAKAQKSAAEAKTALAMAEAKLGMLLDEEEEEEEENQQVISNEKPNNREVIYIRYDDTNMKYVYLCVHCDTTWYTDNRL
jgi:DNA-directed RNA polymerase subunit M/transcription elongation factor TFIIS